MHNTHFKNDVKGKPCHGLNHVMLTRHWRGENRNERILY